MTTLTIQRGDTWEKTFTPTQGGSPFDLAEIEQIWLTFRKSYAKSSDVDDSNATLQITLGYGITLESPDLLLVLTPEQTRTLTRSSYVWDLQFRLTDGRIKTPDSGAVVITSEVTVSV